jgi:REP element-mobilizing transposase RayT
MRYDPQKHHRRSIRLKGCDYSGAGAYCVTLCAQDRACLFGEVVEGEMRLNESGRVIDADWEWLGRRYPYVRTDAWIVMPNHLHGIMFMHDDPGRGGSRSAPTNATKRRPLGRLIGAFKTASPKHIHKMRNTPGTSVWQRNDYEHIIRAAADLDRVRRYVAGNPARWAEDENKPAHAPVARRGI